MNDLVFAFNISETKKTGSIIFESYLCKNAHNKKHKYNGGRVTKVSIWDDIKPNNYSEKELLKIRRLIDKKIYSISTYQYLSMTKEFLDFFNDFSRGNFYYYTNQLDMYYAANCFIEDEYVVKRNDTVCPIDGYDIIYDIQNANIHIIPNGTSEKHIVDVLPRMKLIKSDNLYKIAFEYQGLEISFDSKNYIFEYAGNVIVRKFNYEKKYEEDIIQAGFKKKRDNTYEYIGDREITEVLDQWNIILETEKKSSDGEGVKVYISKTDYDWFDLKLYYKLGDEVIELSKKIDLFSNKQTITIDGQRIALPDSIIENADKLIKDENGIKIPSSNLWTVLQIAGESNIDISEFVSYQDIQLELSEKIEQSILDYQREGARWLKWLFLNKIGGCLADDMGVGKTFQTIAFLSDRLLKNTISKVLVIVPYVLMTNWIREFEKFSDAERPVIYHGADRHSVVSDEIRIVITTYTTAMNDIDILAKYSYDVIVFDEIQYLKNNVSKTYKALSKLKATTRIGLSGTPLENRIDELWNILNILNPGMMLSKNRFIKKYRNGDNDELHTLLNPFIMRRTKNEVLYELPEKYEEIIYSVFYEKQKELYDSIRIAVKDSLRNYGIGANAAILKGLLLLREVCCHPLLLSSEVNVNHISESCKFDVLKMTVKEIVESGNKVIIYSQFVKMLKLIADWFEEESIKYYYMDGGTTNRQEIIDNFELSEQGVFLISLKAGGVGLNLTSAHYAIIYDPWWNPFVEQQAEDRIHRIGQMHDVTIYKMIVADSIEEKIICLQESKREVFSNVLNGISKDKIDLRDLVELL